MIRTPLTTAAPIGWHPMNTTTVMPLDENQAKQAAQELGPPLRTRPISAGHPGNYAQKMVKDPRWGLMTVDDKTRPVFTDPKGGHTVGSSKQSLGALGGPTLMPNMTAPGANFQFGMGRDDRSQRSIDGSIPHGADPFGHQFGDPFQGGADAYGKPDPFMADGSRNPFYMAEGGPVVGPGGPTDDKIPAKLSNGEHVDKASTVLWHGLKTFNKLEKEADEGLAALKAKGKMVSPMMGEDADEKTEPHGMADMREDKAEGEMDDPMGYACGGRVMKMAEGGFVNPYADDPMLYAQRQQEARDAQLAQDGITDQGRGYMTLANSYGTGYSTPTATPQTQGKFENKGGTYTMQPMKAGNPYGTTTDWGMKPVNDVIPSSNPWAADALPFDRSAVRADIAAQTRAMQPGAEVRRAADLGDAATEMALKPKGRGEITVPNANPFPYGDHGGTARTGFMAPWEKDEARRAAADAASGRPEGVRKTDWRRFQRTPQGIEHTLNNQPEEWTPIPGTNYMQGRKGQTVPMARAERTPQFTPEMAKQYGLKIKSVDSKGVFTFISDNGQEEQGVISHIAGNVIPDPNLPGKTIQMPDIPILVNKRTGTYRQLTPEGSRPAAASSSPASNSPSWQNWLDSKLGKK